MVKTGYTALTTFLKTSFFGVILTHFVFTLVSTLVSILAYDSDCEGPIRSWLITSTSVSGAGCIFYIFQPYFGTGLWSLWQLIWSIVGAFWISQGSCSNDYPSGYTSVLSLILLNFSILLILTSLSCIFSIALCIGYGLSSRYQEITE